MILYPLVIALTTLANYTRGGNLGPYVFWSKNDSGWWLSLPLWAIAAFAAGFGWVSLAWPIALYIFASMPWGHLYTFNNFQPDRPWSVLEKVLLKISGGNYFIACYLRMTLGTLAALGTVTFTAKFLGSVSSIDCIVSFATALALGFAITMGYWLGWKYTPKSPTRTGEIIGGAAWGVAMIVLSWVL